MFQLLVCFFFFFVFLCIFNLSFVYIVQIHFRNKKKAYLKAKIEELETNSKVNNVRDLYRH